MNPTQKTDIVSMINGGDASPPSVSSLLKTWPATVDSHAIESFSGAVYAEDPTTHR